MTQSVKWSSPCSLIETFSGGKVRHTILKNYLLSNGFSQPIETAPLALCWKGTWYFAWLELRRFSMSISFLFRPLLFSCEFPAVWHHCFVGLLRLEAYDYTGLNNLERVANSHLRRWQQIAFHLIAPLCCCGTVSEPITQMGGPSEGWVPVVQMSGVLMKIPDVIQADPTNKDLLYFTLTLPETLW